MDRDPIQQNIDGVKQLVGSKMNKSLTGDNNVEGPHNEYIDEFTLDLSDAELMSLKSKWEAAYLGYEAKIKARQNANKQYYLGLQAKGGPINTEFPIAANILFEAEETFLPAALAKNPEPVVWADNTPEGTEISNQVKTMLQYHADVLVLRSRLKLMVRHWSVYFLGVLKHGWNEKVSDITIDNVDPQTLIMDPEASIDVYGDYDGEYIGERKDCTASRLIEMFPKHEEYISETVEGKLGTELTYTEWWTDKYCFYTYKEIILDKNKNPHFNYDKDTEEEDEDGEVVQTVNKGKNHFAFPKKPYTFLSVFTLGEQPHDVTNLIEQNIPNQNLVSKRTEQIDYNLDRANNSIGFSQNNFDEEKAKQAATAMRKGHPVLIPGGDIDKAVVRFPAPAYPDAAFKQLEISKQDLRSIFGTEGISANQPNQDTTARGMILNQSFDNTRIGGGIGDALEQVADNVFNWWVQLYYVYYDEPHFATIMGQMKAVEYITLMSQNLDRRIVVSVTADSMKPKDEITVMNQAQALWDKGALDPKTLFTVLNFPDPQTTAENVVLWLMDKQAYMTLNFPELQQKLMEAQAKTVAETGATPSPGQAPPQVEGGSPIAGPESVAADPASAGLSQVQLPPIA